MSFLRSFGILVLCTAATASLTAPPALSAREQNARTLKPYFATRPISILEWELLQFNLMWQGSFVGNIDYVTSYPVIFDQKAMRFRTTFSLQEKRDYKDPEPFFRLLKPQRESILQGAIDHLVELLGQSFPEVKNNNSLLHAEFLLRSSSGGRSIVAKYENGVLSYSE